MKLNLKYPSRIQKTSWSYFGLILVLLAFSPTQAKDGDVRLEVAKGLTEKGEYDKAVRELRFYLNEHPDATEIYSQIGVIRTKQGNYKLASENFKLALSKNPNLTEAHRGLANVYELMGEKEKAAEVKKFLKIAPKSGPPIVKMPVAHKPGGSNGSVGPNFSPALDSGTSKGPQGIYAQKEFQDALQCYREKKLDLALAMLKKSLTKSPNHPGAYYLGGVIRFEKGDFTKSVYNLKRGVNYPDRGFNSHFYLGRINQLQDKHKEAVAQYEKYLDLSQNEVGQKQVKEFLAQMKPGYKPEAKVIENKSHEVDTAHHENNQDAPVEPPVTAKLPHAEAKPVLLGKDGPFFFIIPDQNSPSGKKLLEAYQTCKQEKYEKAETILKEAALAYGGSDNAEAASLNIASVNLQLGLWENVRIRLEDYLAGAAQDSIKFADGARYLLALAAIGKKDGEAAEKNLLKIRPNSAFGPSQEEIDSRLAEAGEMLKDTKKWATYLERAYGSAKSPSRKAGFAQKLGFLHSKFGGNEKAMEFFGKSIKDCKDSTLADLCAVSQLRLADLAFKKKDWKAALAQYKQFAVKYPEHSEAAWVHFQLANILKVTHNFESALNEYKRVIDNYPDSYWASQAKWKREDAIWQKEYEEVLD